MVFGTEGARFYSTWVTPVIYHSCQERKSAPYFFSESDAMSEKHLIEAIARKYKELPRKKRVAIVREFATRSAADKRFFRRYFPELFAEAFPASAAGARPAVARRSARAAKSR